MATYVIKEWRVTQIENAGSTDNHVVIKGREEGMLSWVMTRLGVSPTVSVEIDANSIRLASGSLLKGCWQRVIPLEHVSSIYHGYTKPWVALLIGWVLIVLAFIFALKARVADISLLASPASLCFPLGVILLVYWFLKKTLTLRFEESGGTVSGFSFQRSVIEGISLGEEQSRQIAELTLLLIDAKKRAGG